MVFDWTSTKGAKNFVAVGESPSGIPKKEAQNGRQLSTVGESPPHVQEKTKKALQGRNNRRFPMQGGPEKSGQAISLGRICFCNLASIFLM